MPLAVDPSTPGTGLPFEGLASKRILLVDSCALRRDSTAVFLTYLGAEVLSSGGGDLPAELHSAPVSCVILNETSVDSGAGWIARLRGDSRYSAVPVILIAPRRAAVPGTDHSTGAEAVLPKPPRRSQLLDTILRVCRDHRASSNPHPLTPITLDQDLTGMRVLLAEDNAVNQKMALLMLRRLGIQADLAANGLEVLQALERQPYDVILMDVQMPELDGLEATRRIRTGCPPDRQPHIVAVTAGVAELDQRACREAGMDDFMAKPFKVPQLTAVLKSARERRAREAAAGR